MKALSQSLVRQIIDYDPVTGSLVDKERPRQLFSNHYQHESWNRTRPGKQTERFIGGTCIPIGLDTYPIYKIVACYMTGKWLRQQKIGFYNNDETDFRWRNLYTLQGWRKIPLDGIPRTLSDEVVQYAETAFLSLPLNETVHFSYPHWNVTDETMIELTDRLKKLAKSLKIKAKINRKRGCVYVTRTA